MDFKIKTIKKLLLNKILDSKLNRTLSEKEHLIDQVLEIP